MFSPFVRANFTGSKIVHTMKRMMSCLLVMTALRLEAQTTSSSAQSGSVWRAPLTTMTDSEYPHNNNIGFKSALAGNYMHKEIAFSELANGHFNICITPGNELSDTILLKDIDLLEMMPTIPSYVAGDNYLTWLALLNQEWNRIQVKYSSKYYQLTGSGDEDKIVSRVDIANN